MNDSNPHLRRGAGLLCLLLVCGASYTAAGAAPVVSNVRSAQRSGTKLVDIYYDLADSDSATVAISVAVSTDRGASYTLPATSFSGSGWGSGVAPGLNKQITWNAGADWNGRYSANVRFRVTADDATAPSGMVLIPAGSFTMGNCMDPDEGYPRELPLHTVYVSAFYMDRYEVTKALWDEVYNWAVTHGYSFEYGAQGKASNHPAHNMTWYEAVKWCNARSQKEGLVPCYYNEVDWTTVYKTGTNMPYAKWDANGYRLPTEAEWEKAARGGASGHRFPWADTDNISHSQANYYAGSSYPYNLSYPTTYHPAFTNAPTPYTSPVGYFAANGYGLYDMAGNVWEWCWDRLSHTYYSSSPGTDPRGPASGSPRVNRGGCWGGNYGGYASGCRAASRNSGFPYGTYVDVGFRVVLPLGQ